MKFAPVIEDFGGKSVEELVTENDNVVGCGCECGRNGFVNGNSGRCCESLLQFLSQR